MTNSNVKHLYRSTHDRMVGGVAGGAAKYFGLDSSLMRLIFVLLILLPGIGVLTYVIAWIIIPEEPANSETHHDTDAASAKSEKGSGAEGAATTDPDKGQKVLGLVFIAIGGFFLLRLIIDLNFLSKFWPVLLVFIGGALIIGRRKHT